MMADHGKRDGKNLITRSNSSSESPNQVEGKAVADTGPRLARLYDNTQQTPAPAYLQRHNLELRRTYTKYPTHLVVRKAAADKQFPPSKICAIWYV